MRQVLNYGIACGYVDDNAAKKIKNPELKRPEVQTFGSWAELEAIAVELGSPLPEIVAGRRWRRSTPRRYRAHLHTVKDGST